MMNHERLNWWLRLWAVRGIGPVRFNQLIQAFGGPREVFDASDLDLKAIPNIDNGSIRFIRDLENAEKTASLQMELAHKLGVAILTSEDDGYPENLKQCSDAPPVLFVKGGLIGSDKTAVAVVGSRNATAYGRHTATAMAREMASAGVTVVSGLARGIDSAAHQGALEAGGRTIAVLGCGVDVVYPPENRRLRDAVAENGAVVSEYPIGERPRAGYFPSRNRIISGLALGVLAVEARQDSGVFSTVRWAAEQGREVFAVPGPINSSTSAGPNHLIRQGAKMVLEVGDILEEIRLPAPKKDLARQPGPEVKLDDRESLVFGQLSDEPRHIDSLSLAAGIQPAEVSRALFSLEMKGLVRQLPGKMFVRDAAAGSR
jgi:DNA processing protein